MDLAEEEMRNTQGKGGTELLGNEKSQEGLDMRETESFSSSLFLSSILKTDSIKPTPPHPPYPYLKSPLKV